MQVGLSRKKHSQRPSAAAHDAAFSYRGLGPLPTAAGLSSRTDYKLKLPATKAMTATNTLTTTAAGPNLTFLWLKNNMPVTNGQNPANTLGTITGATSSKLVITKVAPDNADTYTCQVTMPDPQHPATPVVRSSGVFTVNVTIKPVINTPFTPGPWIVSGPVTAEKNTSVN